MNLSKEIIRLRKKAGLTQEGLAEKTGVSRQAVAKWESGETLPEIDKVILLSEIFRVTLDSLIKGNKPCSYPADVSVQSGEISGLRKFLCEAKRSTYAGHGAEVPPSRPQSHDLAYESGAFQYYDTYLGGEKFSGEEAVWFNGVPVWTMNYIGRVTGNSFSGDFLKEALFAVSEESPYRGPELFVNGDYTYHCKTEGTFEWYNGEEAIFYKKDKIYECMFHGGYVK